VAHLRFGQLLAFVILCAAIAAILLLCFLALMRHRVRLPYSLLLFPRRKSALLENMRLERFYERGIARLEGRWAGTGASGEEFTRPKHPYEQDLHLFGEGSLFQLLCTCRTEIGRRSLAGYLLDAPDLQEVTERKRQFRNCAAAPICVSESVCSVNSILRNPGGTRLWNGWNPQEFWFILLFALRHLLRPECLAYFCYSDLIRCFRGVG
jgi:hypothetical protein